MDVTYVEAMIIFIKSLIKMMGIFLHSGLIGIALAGIGTMIYNHKKIVRVLRRISAEN